jgi:hypothetical protein
MRGRHAVLATAVVAAVALAAVSAATAGDPGHVHLAFSGTETQDDYCGTGKTVADSFTINVNIWAAPNQPALTRNQSESTITITNPANGASVIVHNAYTFTDMFVSGDPAGVNVHAWTFTGNAELIRAAGGGVLGHDRGVLVVRTTWDGPEFSGEFLGAEVVSDRGGHPLFGNDCGVLVPALGLG